MFPFDMDEADELEMAAAVEVTNETEIKPEYEIDFDTLQLTGRMITGVDAVKQWIRLCLETPRYRYTQYPWTYGQDFEELIGKGYTEGDLKPILKRMVTEALSENSEIKSISDFEVKKSGDFVRMSFKIDTIYGDTDYSLNILGG